MKRICCRRVLCAALAFLICICCCSCGQAGKDKKSNEVGAYKPGVTHVLVPVSGDQDTVTAGALTLDFTNVSDGYFTGRLSEPGKTINIQVTGPDQVIYKYFLDNADAPAVFPLTAGNGSYIVLAFENVGGDQYVSLLTHSLTLELKSEFLPFLYPNQYVDFSEDNEAIHLAAELSADAKTDLESLTAIYQ